MGVVQSLAEGDRVFGVTSLGEEIYVLRWKDDDRGGTGEFEVYDVITYQLKRRLAVPNSREFSDVSSCEHYRCIYASDHIIKCVHRLEVQGAATQWAVNNVPRALSVNAAHNVLVTCGQYRKIKEFTSRGYLLREVVLPEDIVTPWHAVMSDGGQFIVCHGHAFAAEHRVCKVSADGRHIVHAHGGQRGSDIDQYNIPRHLAVDNNEFVFVLDIVNRRVTMLSPTFKYKREVVTPEQLKWWPYRMFLDVRRRRLYVTDNGFENGIYTSGRVVVFSV